MHYLQNVALDARFINDTHSANTQTHQFETLANRRHKVKSPLGSRNDEVESSIRPQSHMAFSCRRPARTGQVTLCTWSSNSVSNACSSFESMSMRPTCCRMRASRSTSHAFKICCWRRAE